VYNRADWQTSDTHNLQECMPYLHSHHIMADTATTDSGLTLYLSVVGSELRRQAEAPSTVQGWQPGPPGTGAQG